MKAIVVTRQEADRILSGEQTILTHEQEIQPGRLALVVDDAAVCTVTVDDALPIIGPRCANTRHLCVSGWGLLAHSVLDEPWPDGETEHDRTDQLPLGDFTPGRWGWLLSDPRPITAWRCLYKTDKCSPPEPHIGKPGCGWRPADSIPCTGKQGVFDLPADAAEAVKS